MDLAFLVAVIGVAGAAVVALKRRGDPTRLALATVTPTPRTAMVDGGLVVVRGTVGFVEPRAHLTSPITRRQCVYWRVTFDELGIGGDFAELGRIDQGRPFLVSSEEGVTRIVLEHARVAVPGSVSLFAMRDLDNSWYNDAGIRLARTVCKRPNYPGSSSLRVTEYVVVPEMDVTIQGYCTHEPDPQGADDITGYRADVPLRPVLSGTKRSPLLLADSAPQP